MLSMFLFLYRVEDGRGSRTYQGVGVRSWWDCSVVIAREQEHATKGTEVFDLKVVERRSRSPSLRAATIPGRSVDLHIYVARGSTTIFYLFCAQSVA